TYSDNFAPLIPRTQNDKVLAAIIPGLGLSYMPFVEWTFFAGIHRGFAPPRTKDNILPNGQVLNLAAEHSWNYELGARYTQDDWFSAELAGFVLDFSREAIAPNEASGIVATPGAVIAGAALHTGVELSANFDPGLLFDLGYKLPLGLN